MHERYDELSDELTAHGCNTELCTVCIAR